MLGRWRRATEETEAELTLRSYGSVLRYQCGLASAFLVKNLVEAHRSRNELGHLVWQLNEVS